MDIAQKTILVTGGAGFIGSNFVSQMVEAGHKVIVIDALTYAGFRENLSWIETPAISDGSWVLHEGNICDGDLVSQQLTKYQPDWLVNFAAESHVDNSIEKPSTFIDTNIVGCYTLLEAARQYWSNLEGAKQDNFRMLHISTDEVFGSLGATGKFSETTAYKPNSPYSASKAASDHLCRAWYKTYDLPVIVTNCTNNYGERQHPEKLIPLMINNALAGKALPIYGDGKNIRDWIHVSDHCRGVYLALAKGKAGEHYGFGGDAERNNIQVVDIICNILDELKPANNGKSYSTLKTFVKDRLGHDRRYAIDDSKAISELGFTREYDFESGIRSTIQWYIDNKKWCESVSITK